MIQMIRKAFQNTSKTMRIAILIIYDICAVCIAEFLALWTRFEFSISQIDPKYANTALHYTIINIITTLIIFIAAKLYSSLWRYASVHEMLHACKALGCIC